MKPIDTFIVTPKLLNPVGTLAAPQMLTRAHQAGFVALGENATNEMSLVGYSAEFKEGAREGEVVNVTIDEAEGLWPGDRAFRIHFGKDNDTRGRSAPRNDSLICHCEERSDEAIFADQNHCDEPLPSLNQLSYHRPQPSGFAFFPIQLMQPPTDGTGTTIAEYFSIDFRHRHDAAGG